MKIDAISQVSFIKRTLKSHVISWLIQAFEEFRIIESWIKPFNEILPNGIETFSIYIQKRIMTMLYKSMLIYTVINYLISESTSNYIRILFSIIFLYHLLKLYLIIPSYNLDKLQLWSSVDIFFIWGENIYINFSNSRGYEVTNSLILLFYSFIPIMPKIGRASCRERVYVLVLV